MPNRLIDLPPLDLLRTFVAVGRRMSITLAAQDLCIVQSAVSRQIQALEAALGCRLFVRAYRSIEFTPEGRHLFRSADPMLEQLGRCDRRPCIPAGERPCITITATIGVTALWLLPRLGAFQRSAPDIDVRVAATNRVWTWNATAWTWRCASARTRWRRRARHACSARCSCPWRILRWA
jgi:LysR family glycine cleavage system transcriptional activator